MADFECQALGPSLSTCGAYGSCANGTVCLCRQGWEKSTEIAFYLSKEEFEFAKANPDSNNLVCDLKPGFLRFLYLLALFLTSTIFFKQLIHVRKWKHLKKLYSYLITCSCAIVFCLIRAIDLQRAVGEDVFVTLLFAVVHIFGNIGVIRFNNKFIRYQVNSNQQFIKEESKFDPKKLQLAQGVLFFLDTFIGILMICGALVDDRDTTKKLFLASFGIYFFRSFHQIWAVEYFTKFVIKDMDYVLLMMKENSKSNKLDEFELMQMDSMVSSRRGLMAVYYSMMVYTAIIMFFYGTAWLSDIGLVAYKYFMPLQIILGMVWSLIVLVAWKHRKGSKGTMTASSSESRQAKPSAAVSGTSVDFKSSLHETNI
mmetsp:Transcript_17674/g.21434  ORF Transcript_17674/g.21434 Transcript_17674/m.21434 type:complete len:370 (-) Transcript_17674:77-1186(-)